MPATTLWSQTSLSHSASLRIAQLNSCSHPQPPFFMAYGREWPTVLRVLWVFREASLVKSPFFATHKSTMHLQERYLVQANLGDYATAVGRYVGDLKCLATHAIQKWASGKKTALMFLTDYKLIKILALLSFSGQLLHAIHWFVR